VVLNSRGQVAFVGIMIGLLIIITAIALSGSLKDVVAQGYTNMTCSYTNLTPAQTGTCIILDWTFPGFIGLCILVGISYVTMKRLVSGNSGGPGQ
jgi:hypothetical protein